MTKHGLSLSFLSSFTGQVDFLHMEPEQAASYKEGDEVKLLLLLLKITLHFLCLNFPPSTGPSLRVVRGAVHPSGGPEPAQPPCSRRSQGWPMSSCRWPHWWGGEVLQDDHSSSHVWSHAGTARQNQGLRSCEFSQWINVFKYCDTFFNNDISILIEKPP